MDEADSTHWAILVFGSIAGFIFYARFYTQWIYSEIKGRSIVPPLFWYQSAIGSILLLIYAGITQSPLGALSQCINVLPYSRNLMFIWKEKGLMTKRLRWFTYIVVGLCMIGGVTTVVWLWVREAHITQDVTTAEARQTWLWLAVGVVGQGLFGTRFLIQWIATEMNRKSIVPTVFWYISLLASVLMCASFFQRGEAEWVYAVGTVSNVFIYARNIWMIHTRGPEEAPEEARVS